jgi:hypothetical protein
MVKKSYWYINDGEVISSHEIPQSGVAYLEKIVNVIGVPYLRAVSIKDSHGELLYNDIENIPLEDNLVERYLGVINR